MMTYCLYLGFELHATNARQTANIETEILNKNIIWHEITINSNSTRLFHPQN